MLTKLPPPLIAIIVSLYCRLYTGNAFVTKPSLWRNSLTSAITTIPKTKSLNRIRHANVINSQTAPLSSTLSSPSSDTLSSSPLTSTSTGTIPSSAQILQFREPKTNTTVLLIGTMHYNPTSISLVETTLQSLSSTSSLGSVIIESCDLRWNTSSTSKNNSRTATFLRNEMRVAHDVAVAQSCPVVLGDQRINITGAAATVALRETLLDLCTPFSGGWERCYKDIRAAADAALPQGEGYLDARGFLDARLLLAAPATFVKYPLAWFLRFPLGGTAILGLLGVLNYVADVTSQPPETMSAMDTLTDLYGSLMFALFEVLVLGRIMLKTILADRNEVLARNILAQCRIYSRIEKEGENDPIDFVSGVWQQLTTTVLNAMGGDKEKIVLASTTSSDNDDDLEILYAPDSIIPMKGNIQKGGDKVVVAVMGMAHCNGVMKLLREESV